MHKRQMIDHVRAARSAHIQWRARAQAMVSGLPLNESQVPVAYTDCKFGKWYYGEGQSLSQLESFKGIEEPHEQLHLVYMKIFHLLYGESEQSLFARLFGSAKKHAADALVQAERILPQLVAISETLLVAIDVLERDIREMSEEEFADLVEGD